MNGQNFNLQSSDHEPIKSGLPNITMAMSAFDEFTSDVGPEADMNERLCRPRIWSEAADHGRTEKVCLQALTDIEGREQNGLE